MAVKWPVSGFGRIGHELCLSCTVAKRWVTSEAETFRIRAFPLRHASVASDLIAEMSVSATNRISSTVAVSGGLMRIRLSV